MPQDYVAKMGMVDLTAPRWGKAVGLVAVVVMVVAAMRAQMETLHITQARKVVLAMMAMMPEMVVTEGMEETVIPEVGVRMVLTLCRVSQAHSWI